ncbi:MAG: hypothetical protein JWQ04_511 [Pedosphaera sp.]|nr:hypothetical protein [Pedosphaera sp.]
MLGKTKLVFILGLAIALSCFTGFLLTRAGKHASTLHQLPDGSWLQFGEVSFTNGNHTFVAKPFVGWRAKVSKVLPRNWAAQLGWARMGGSIGIGGAGKGTNLAFSTVHVGKPLPQARLVVSDEQGNSFSAGGNMGEMSTTDGKQSLQIYAWAPPAFPRRGKSLNLRFYESGPGQKQPVAEFMIPNPAAGSYPTWSAEAMPVTKTDDDLSVTLENLQSGLSKADKTRPGTSNEAVITQASLRLVLAGRATNAWRAKTVEISDATGNDWVPYPYMVSASHEKEMDYMAFDGALWPGESAWKLRFEFSRVADFEPDETCTFTGVTVPGATQIISLDNITSIAGAELKLMTISGENAEQPGNLKWYTVKNRVNISIRINPFTPDHRLTLLKVTDESGREAEISEEPDWNARELVYAFQPPEGAKRLSFTFALHKSRFAEFVVKPEFVRAN